MRLFATLLTVPAMPRFATSAAAGLLGLAGLAASGSVLAQTPATPLPVAAKAALLERTANAPSKSDQLIENIQVDSAGARIDEQRFGGETRSISVAPKGGFPVYDVQPASGLRTWKVLGF
jgi:hypothetical protein